MKEFVSHRTAARMWDIPYLGAILREENDEVASVDITYSTRGARLPRKGRNVHCSGLSLPSGAVVIKDDCRIASPELVFLELAHEFDIHKLILLGLQLCSHPPGHPELAITTRKRIIRFVAKVSGQCGHRKAQRAAKYLENGSASIMESLVYMILTLPCCLGGYGLSGAEFNHEIELKDDARCRLGQYRCFVDFYYRTARLAVEYQSFAHHSNPTEQGRDMVRSAALERQGIEVMCLSTTQLYDTSACREFAFNLSERLGKKIQIRAANFEENHWQIRTLLPRVR